MNEVARLLAEAKRQLRRRGLGYRDVAAALGLSEASVKRLFGNGRFTLDRLAGLAELLGLSLAELAQAAAANEPRVRALSPAQEAALVADSKRLLVAVCALNHWTLADMVAGYRLGTAECIGHLLHLERLRLIELLPGNRIRIVVARDFDWLPDGPIRSHFRASGQDDFLNGRFAAPDEAILFLHGMLDATAMRQLHEELDRLRRRFAEWHEAALATPFRHRHGTGLLLAVREWEPPAFAALRRTADDPPRPGQAAVGKERTG
ncbi:transcriptional regulator [Parasulfuritortus cantonensis]|uniref:Transcriptional regulator n=1 Tax=Parasulfuritortus cantonensis TaxID=2528202 RepID=A0A4R1BMC6_9PROT|nr:helix-turn-helix domain-containing protein [Parasulfuritortus cantonensis]TCJ18574.1 transcriptional regulator [Parasulfuritortus cantonensis]